MRYVVLDTDVSSLILRRRLPSTLAARLAGTLPYITFVTLGELTQWAELRNWGERSRAGLEAWLSCVGFLEYDREVARTGGRLSARGHQRAPPANAAPLRAVRSPVRKLPSWQLEWRQAVRWYSRRVASCSDLGG